MPNNLLINNIKEVSKITFGVLSADEIKKLAVCEIDNPKLFGGNGKDTGYGTVYDPRLGTIENGVRCEICELDIWEDPGHWGVIKLNKAVIHPLYYKRVIEFLKCTCIKCHKLLLTKELFELYNLKKYNGIKRFNKILEKLEKFDMCPFCSFVKPDIKYNTIESSVVLSYKNNKEKISVELDIDEIKNIFDNIGKEDVIMLGFDPELLMPSSLILTVFPVMPVASRPYVICESNICDDDLTIQLIEIIKINNNIKNLLNDETVNETKIQKQIQSLKFRISTFFNNSGSRCKHSMSGRSLKGLKERLSGKDGLIRNSLMGKRTDGSCRSVISPDPTLRADQVAVPKEIADNLTIPEQVTKYNFDYLTELVNNDGANFVIKKDINTKINLKHNIYFKGTQLEQGDIIIRNGKEYIISNGKDILQKGDLLKRNGILIDVKYPEKRKYNLEIGDIVERKLKDGDMCLLNPKLSYL